MYRNKKTMYRNKKTLFADTSRHGKTVGALGQWGMNIDGTGEVGIVCTAALPCCVHHLDDLRRLFEQHVCSHIKCGFRSMLPHK